MNPFELPPLQRTLHELGLVRPGAVSRPPPPSPIPVFWDGSLLDPHSKADAPLIAALGALERAHGTLRIGASWLVQAAVAARDEALRAEASAGWIARWGEPPAEATDARLVPALPVRRGAGRFCELPIPRPHSPLPPQPCNRLQAGAFPSARQDTRLC